MLKVNPRRFAIPLLAILVLLATGVRSAPTTLHVVGDSNYPPYLFVAPNGKTEGYIVDLWKLWSRKTGVKVDLEPMQWDRAQRAMHDGKADVIDMIYRSPVRDQLYTFSKPYATETIGIYVDSSIHGIHDARSLNGFKIGVQRGDACIERLSAAGLDTRDLVAYPDYNSLLSAAKAGNIKIFCMDDDPANYYLYLMHEQLQFAKAFTLYSGHFHWAVNRGDAATYALVARGMARITPQERARLKRKWFSQNLHYRSYVRNILFVVLAALGVLIVASAWIWILRRAVRVRTEEIRKKNDLLEEQSHMLINDRARLRTLVESSPDAMWLKDKDGVYVDCNHRACELIGQPRENIIGQSDRDQLIPGELMRKVDALDQRVRKTGMTQSGEFLFHDARGRTLTMELVKAPIRAPDGSLTGLLGVARDITERRRAEEERRIAAIAFDSHDGIVICDASGIIQRVNPAFSTLTGYTQQDAAGSTLAQLVRTSLPDKTVEPRMDTASASEDSWSGNLWISPRHGVLRFIRLTTSKVREDRHTIRHIVHMLHDLTSETEAQARIQQLEKYDALTELPNRRLLEERIRAANEAAASHPDFSHCHGALLLIGLDNFALLNNAHGHKLGDRVLQQTVQRMQHLRSGGSMLARFSGDEFALLLTFPPRPCKQASDAALRLARALCDALAKPYMFGRIGEVICTASIGVTLMGYPTRSADSLLVESELAMFKAKQEGKNKVRLFENQMQQEIDTRNSLARDLRKSIRADHFVLHFQPQVDATGRIVGAEALLRWMHPDRGLLTPGEFIDVAEQTGLIEPLGRLVVQQACLILGAWSALPGLRQLGLSVNVSPRQFQQSDFVDQMAAVVSSCGTNVHKLKLEITESMAMEDIRDASAKLEGLKRLGLKLSLDDFGTGSSSLAYLTRLPLDQIKIDQSFVRQLPDAQSDAHLARSILGMAHGMELEVVAEGVETQSQFEFLRNHQCELFQGYLFGKPMPRDDFERHVQASAAHGTVQG